MDYWDVEVAAAAVAAIEEPKSPQHTQKKLHKPKFEEKTLYRTIEMKPQTPYDEKTRMKIRLIQQKNNLQTPMIIILTM